MQEKLQILEQSAITESNIKEKETIMAELLKELSEQEGRILRWEKQVLKQLILRRKLQNPKKNELFCI